MVLAYGPPAARAWLALPAVCRWRCGFPLGIVADPWRSL